MGIEACAGIHPLYTGLNAPTRFGIMEQRGSCPMRAVFDRGRSLAALQAEQLQRSCLPEKI